MKRRLVVYFGIEFGSPDEAEPEDSEQVAVLSPAVGSLYEATPNEFDYANTTEPDFDGFGFRKGARSDR